MTSSYRDTISDYLGRPGLERQMRHLCWIASFVSLGETKVLREAIVSALQDEVQPDTIREAILQSYLFVGYPRVINALFLLKEMCESRGIDYPSETIASEDYTEWRAWKDRGEVLCRKIYGSSYDRLQERISGLHPLLARWMIVEGYGKVLSREGLPARLREMLVLSILISQEVWRQLRSHILGGFHLGITGDETGEVIAQLVPFLPVGVIEKARELFAELTGPEDRD